MCYQYTKLYLGKLMMSTVGIVGGICRQKAMPNSSYYAAIHSFRLTISGYIDFTWIPQHEAQHDV